MTRSALLLLALALGLSSTQAQHEAAYDALGAFSALDGNERRIYVDLRKEDVCQLTFEGKPFTTVCFQAWARKSVSTALSPEEARTYLRAGEDLEVRRFERADARSRREQMMTRNDELRLVPRPTFPCFNAAEPRAAICSSYALTILENDYVQLAEQAENATITGAWFDAPAGHGPARQRAFEHKLTACKASHDCLEDAFLDELQLHITQLLNRGINVQMQVTQLQSRRRPAPASKEEPKQEPNPEAQPASEPVILSSTEKATRAEPANVP